MSRQPTDSFFNESKDYRSRFQQLMLENGCETPKQFAAFLGVNYATVARGILHGRIPSTCIVTKLCDKLKLSCEYFLALSDENNYKPTQNPTPFKIRLVELAQEKGETLGAVARNLTILKASIYDWAKSGQLPSVPNAIVLAEYFDVTIDYLLGRSDSRN